MAGKGGYGKGGKEAAGRGGSKEAREPPTWDHVEFSAQLASAKGQRDWKNVKTLLAKVSESNYQARYSFGQVPKTVLVSAADADKLRAPNPKPRKPPVQDAIGKGFIEALNGEYVKGTKAAVQKFFDSKRLSEEDQELLAKFEAEIRKAKDKARAIAQISSEWGIGNGALDGAVISFSTMDTVEAMQHFRERGHVVCGLNYANGETPGGGYKNGSTAQEEDLCRRMPTLYSTLFQAQKDGLYPFGPATYKGERPEKYSDVLYTPNLRIGRESDAEGFRWSDGRHKVSMVAACAPNVKFASEVHDPEMVYKTIETIFKAPLVVEPEVTTLVLGAWGCGAFGGNPLEIGKMMVRAIVADNLSRPYREVHFAIPKTSPEDVNYDRFRAAFEQFGESVQVVDR